jgi:crotonobetainyl-CoA:carnitine CoA-transferase CaiB-like acyl-CoA transferase
MSTAQDKEMFFGLKVLELASVLAGPSVGQFFAELGAEVIKVENLTTQGDVTRTWRLKEEDPSEVTAYFCSVNLGKKSIAINLGSKEGQDLVAALAQKCDVVVVSFKPGDAERLGVDYASLSQHNPRLIYGQVTGYGSQNPRVGYDALIQAEAGFMLLNGPQEGPPVKMPVALMDLLAGHQLKEALLLALLRRERTGKGGLVEVSLVQSGVASLANQATAWLVAGVLPRAMGSAHPSIAPYGDIYRTAEGHWLVLAVGNDKQFKALAGVLGHPELAEDGRFCTNPLRVQHREELNPLLSTFIAQMGTSGLLADLQIRNVPAGRIQSMAEVFAMEEAKELLVPMPQGQGLRTFVGKGIEVNKNLKSPPSFSADTLEVLTELGLSDEQVASLRQKGVVG